MFVDYNEDLFSSRGRPYKSEESTIYWEHAMNEKGKMSGTTIFSSWVRASVALITPTPHTYIAPLLPMDTWIHG